MLVRDLRCSVLVGRDVELEQLLDAIERTGAGAGETVVLLGEAGVGKSRLAEAAVAAARSRGIVVLRGRGTPSPAPAPYRPIAEALLSGLRDPEMRPPDGLSRFRAAFGVLVPGWSGDDVGLPAYPSVILLGESVLALLRVLGGPGGVLLLLEDLHWADPGTLELLDYVVDKLGASKAVVLATVRAGEASPAEKLARSLHARRQVSVVDLGRLPADDVTRMVAACLGQEHPPSELVRVVHEASDGLPFLVEEVLTALVSTHSIVRAEDGWRVVGPLRSRVPPSFAATVEERMRALSPPARRVV
ncbi:MAG: AAA family ATPase, partial [Actinomycetota bacterium]|nr:AAA family ATPase [Actinomycetota bacterium]